MSEPPWHRADPYSRESYESVDHVAAGMNQLSMHEITFQNPSPFQPFIPYTGPSAFHQYQPYPYQSYQYIPSNQGTANLQSPAFTSTAAWSSPPATPRHSIVDNTYIPWRGRKAGGSAPFHQSPWMGQANDDKARERRAYHPQPPSNRSDWVMWVGNVPPNTTHEELWKYFNSGIGLQSWRGPSSIFLISRSSCAFVNLTSEEDLSRAVAHFNGRPLRPYDPRCPKLVCRVRKKDDDLRSGVGAQRGTGMHREWVKKQSKPETSEVPEGQGRRRESVVDNTKHKSSASCASTNSSFLMRNFPMRCFILKSSTINELEESARTGIWKTQRHNEPVLDQAFRTSQEVFLIFGANKSGEFFGYAKMIEPIDKEKAKKYSSGSSKPMSKVEEDTRRRGGSEPPRPTYFLLPSQSHIASTSPGELTPTEEYHAPDVRSYTDPAKKNDFFASQGEDEALKQQARGGSLRQPVEGDDGVLRKDTALTPEDTGDHVAEAREGTSFHIQWIKVGRLPFNQTRHLRNPWNADREVKVSRDGTELEPGVATSLMQLWD